MLAVVLQLTASYSKLEDRAYLDKIASKVFRTAEPNRSHRGHVSADLRRLADIGSIYRRAKPGRPSSASGGPLWVIGLPDAETRPSTGAIPGEEHTPPDTETRPSAGAIPEAKRARPERETRPTSTRNAPVGGGPTEKTSEKTSERPAGRSLRDRVAALTTTPPASLRPGEIDQVVTRLVAELRHQPVADALTRLEAATASFTYPRELAGAVRTEVARAAREAARAAEERTLATLASGRHVEVETSGRGPAAARDALTRRRSA